MSTNGTFSWVETQTQVASLGPVCVAGTGDTDAAVVATLIPAGSNTAFSVRMCGPNTAGDGVHTRILWSRAMSPPFISQLFRSGLRSIPMQQFLLGSLKLLQPPVCLVLFMSVD